LNCRNTASGLKKEFSTEKQNKVYPGQTNCLS
jgi:hypothetical protein